MEKYFDINAHGKSVRCKLYRAERPDGGRVIVYVHGFAGHKDNGSAKKLAGRVTEKYKDVSVLCFDLPCHGEDAGSLLTTAACLGYIRTVCDYALTDLGAGELLCCANSFGGYLAMRYAAEHGSPFKKTALRSPAVDMYSTIIRSIISDEDMKKLSKGKPVSVGFDRKIKIDADFLNDLRANDITRLDLSSLCDDVVIIQGDSDEIVSFDSVRDFAERNYMDFYPIEGADHRFRDPRRMEEALKLITRFLLD